ncbi:MAG: LysE family transporter [Chloroflexota bacterium]
MLSTLLSLIVISFTGVMAPGPMFAVTLARSYSSPWAGLFLALGHAVVEVPLIFLIYFGFGTFFQKNNVRLALSLIGGGVIIWLGISLFHSRSETISGINDVTGMAFTSGILMSALNPFFLLWWATVGSMLISRFVNFGLRGMVAFTVAHWSCDLIWLSFVSILVYHTHAFWGQQIQEWLLIACSLLLIGFGSWFIISGLKLTAQRNRTP